MTRIAIVVGSTRPGRYAEVVAQWVHAHASKRDDAEFTVLDIADFGLPLLDEPVPPMAGEYRQPHTQAWAATIASFDGFVFVTPEYNNSVSGALKNALDYLYAEWNDKAAGFVGYGAQGGVRAVQQLRVILGELRMADVRATVALSLDDDVDEHGRFAPRVHHEDALTETLDQLIAWAVALRALRVSHPASPAGDTTRGGTAEYAHASVS
ncbi:NADPH-dependent FMN reductase [Phytoactinopolyspora mesophila]|uniref:NADPH-dependent FMN reductase n=1 Tax=Phytoactinopolyspora mesophila TaxID=2650750 RepID=A0A7K3MBT8_9ACTN|nr:NAD(P)H-dependent oxidoreductase [Phytoactinopolyspora mesophila]NDL60487.1 NADPH-dependent FMN reductase [Phytoactinopolyspora mesophila]